MPLLFSIGIQGALEEVATSLAPEEHLCAFLDDIYLLCPPERVVPLYKLLSKLARVAGIRLHPREDQGVEQGRQSARGCAGLGPEPWQTQGLKVLGTPIGTPEMNDRIEDERRLWETIPVVPDLQCAWQLLAKCQPQGQPQFAHHATKLDSRACESARRRHVADSGNSPATDTRHGGGTGICQGVGNLPDEDGRVGSQVCNQMRKSAFWAWADALPMIRERTPQVAEMVVHAMNGEPTGCLGELQEASRRLDREGFLVETTMARASSWQTTAAEHNWGARRVATRLAVLGFFHFRRVLQEDPDTVSPSSQLSRTSSVPLQCWSSARLRSHGTRVRDSPSLVPDHARMLSTTCSLSFAASLVEPWDSCTTWCLTGGEAPPLAELFGQDPR